MGTGEQSSPSKSSKPTPSVQETSSTPSYPDWSASVQAYYGGAGATPPPFFASPMTSPAPHPYLWGSQHPMVAPYGTNFPYPTLYPHGGLYAHPNMAMGGALTNTEVEERAADGKVAGFTKKSSEASGNTGLTGGKSGESVKGASGSGQDGTSQSAESASEGSSEGSDENANQLALSATKKRGSNQIPADALVPGKSATNLNMGMDIWSASPVQVTPTKTRPDASATSLQVASASGAVSEGVVHDQQWIQEERELKREKRKQSNRESARRSRLRKQAECEELQVKVDKLSNENRTLRDEVLRMAEECEKMTSENDSIMDELSHVYGVDVVSNLRDSFQKEVFQSVNKEDQCHGLDTSTGNNTNSQSDLSGHFFDSNGKRTHSN